MTYADGREVKGRWEKGKLVEIDKKIHEEEERDEGLKPIGGKIIETPSK